MIGGVKSAAYSAFRHGGPLTMKYYLNEKNFNEVWNFLLYEVFAKKRDGSASAKHALTNSHFIVAESQLRSGDYYIKRKIN